MSTRTRKIVKIDADKCDGCGLCVPDCAEGAIQILNGKATLMADNLCDGLGNCLGACPRDAISIIEREADKFDEAAVETMGGRSSQQASCPAVAPPSGCPGAMARNLAPSTPAPTACPGAAGESKKSQLSHWPIQLSLVPTTGTMWNDADVLISADCVAHAMGNFHEALLVGKTLVIACPKLDNLQAYVAKLTDIFANNNIRSLTVAHMKVPCCNGIVMAVRQALAAAGRNDVPVRDITVGIDGSI